MRSRKDRLGKREWVTHAESDIRSFEMHPKCKHAARDAQSWIKIVTEGGRRFMTERKEENGENSKTHQEKRIAN